VLGVAGFEDSDRLVNRENACSYDRSDRRQSVKLLASS
jgi:hypothetical protein